MNRQVFMLVISIGALSLGVMFYALERRHDYVYFLSWFAQPYDLSPGFWGGIGESLPSFVHVYAFILLTAVVTAPPVTRLILLCLAWFSLDTLLEIAQIHSIAIWIARHTPAWFSGIPFLENTTWYFLSGTFDIRDLLSIGVGTLAAYLTVYMTHRGFRIEK